MSTQDENTLLEDEIPPVVEDPNKEYIDDNSVLMRLSDKKYPLSFYQVRGMVTNVIFAERPDTEIMESLGFVVVHESTRPTGDVVTEVTPELGEDGKWYRAYTVRPYTPEELQAATDNERNVRLQLLGIRLNERLAQGYEFTPPAGPPNQHLGLTDVDVFDLNTTYRAANTAIDRGRPTTHRIRTVEKQTLTLTSEDTVALLDEAFGERQRIQGLSWDLEDLLAAAETIAEMPEIPARLD